jgi:hypothetical protein
MQGVRVYIPSRDQSAAPAEPSYGRRWIVAVQALFEAPISPLVDLYRSMSGLPYWHGPERIRPRRPVFALATFVCALRGLIGEFAQAQDAPGCTDVGAGTCIARALDAMGGRHRLSEVRSVALDVIGHTELMEQSYRQAPFITAYHRNKILLDLGGGRMREDGHDVWPESDPAQAELDLSLIVTADGGGFADPKGDSPCGLSTLDDARQALAFGPLRLLMTAADAKDLHYEAAQTLRATPHTVVAFTWHAVPVRILINADSHLPDAVETTQQFQDFWYFWGDTQQRVYWDNWKVISGIVYPTNEIIERNGAIWRSNQTLDIGFNSPIDEKRFALDPKVAQQSTQGKGWEIAFKVGAPVKLAEALSLYSGPWNTTIIKQDDGVVILDAPISGVYTQGIIEEAKRQYPGAPIKAVLSSSDSWPHVGGIRYAVAQGLPIYILDLNKPLLDRLITAEHSIKPDPLQASKKPPDWKIVAGKVEIGSGPNRMELFPMRGAATERQYMVYFPAHRLLYASDTLVIDPEKHTLYDPELLHEVQQAVEREHLHVDTVFGMHQAPTPWKDAITLLQKAS